jgi:hypothetical protein
MKDTELVTKRNDVKLKGHTAAEQRQKGKDERGYHVNWCKSEEREQLRLYHSDRSVREPQFFYGELAID